MNERIKLLFGNALDKAVPYTWHNLDHIEVEKVMTEFAELIVQECANVAWDIAHQYNSDEINDVGYSILEHFGVDE